MARFQNTELLWALSLLPLLGLLWYRMRQWKKAVKQKIGHEKSLAELTRHDSPSNHAIKFIWVLAALSAIILGAANLQRPAKGTKINRKGLDLVIAVDLSKSMLARDMTPSRLEKARQLVYKLMDAFSKDRVGLVFFAGRAYLQMPLSYDHHAAQLYMQNADPALMPTQGTAIGEALKMCNTAFLARERKYKAVVLITDGEDHDAEALKLIPALRENGIMVNTIGMGSASGSRIIDPVSGNSKKDAEGREVISKLNESLLQQLAEDTRGIYIAPGQINTAVDKLQTHLGRIEETAPDDTSLMDFESFFQLFIGLALILLVLELFWPERKWKTT